MKESVKFLYIVGAFLFFWFLPIDYPRFNEAISSSLHLTKWYAREHVLLCLIPAFFIAGAVSVFVSQGAVMKYLGAKTHKVVAYSIAAVSGAILAVCSCTILPLFSSIYKRGAGLGPAIAFLYSGPAINVLAIILTARILGFEMGVARAVGAISFSVIIGLAMQFIFRKEVLEVKGDLVIAEEVKVRPLWKEGLYFASMLGLLVFLNWGKPMEGDQNLWSVIYQSKWIISGIFAVLLGYILFAWFQKEELKGWVESSWEFAKQILPLLLGGVMVAGFLLGGPNPENHGIIPQEWVSSLVGGNSFFANFFASIAGAFMYFATLTEVPILAGLMNSGMGKGPALALLLAGPALSLPSMLVIRNVVGNKKTIVFVSLVVFCATLTGYVYGLLFP